MVIYAEGLLWYLVFLDCLIFNLLCWTQGKWHQKTTHWISPYIPMNKVVGVFYFLLVLWVGSTLYRLSVILFR